MTQLLKQLMIAILLLSPIAMAHTDLKSSIPADQQHLSMSPEQLQLFFAGKVTLAKVNLHHQAGKVDTGFTPIMRPQKTFQIALPALADGSYTIKWMAIGKDGHKIKGTIRFTLETQG